MGAVITGAVIMGAVITGAVITGAVITGAVIINWDGYNVIPFVTTSLYNIWSTTF
jgi:uncharacterized protein YjbI with pentapeptide repeats